MAARPSDYAYDLLGRLTSIELPDPDGAGPLARPETTFEYDAAGNRVKLTDPVSNVTTWTYDDLDRVTQSTNALSDSRSYDYDAAGQLTERTDRNGRVIEFDYDDLGRVAEERWLDGATTVNTLEFEYKPGRPCDVGGRRRFGLRFYL